MTTILFAGGGTLGHIIPAVAVARELQKQYPNASVHFVCSPRGEAEFLKKESFPFTIIDAPRISLSLLWKFWSAYGKSRVLLQSLKPDLIFSKGGYVSVPVCLAAKRMKIPIILHESDAVMGRANRLIAKMAREVFMKFPDNPVREETTQGSRNKGLKLTGFSGARPILLVMGGSQGAQAINHWTMDHLEELTSSCDVIHLTGPGKIVNRKSQIANRHYFGLPFAHNELSHLYTCSDIAISRAGAGSIAELSANGIPSILIPLRGVAHDHQVFNARSLQERGAAVLVTPNEMDKELMNVLKQLIDDPAAREKLRSKIRELCTGSSTGQIVKVISRTLVEGGRA